MALALRPEYVMGWEVLAEIYDDMGMLHEKRDTEAKLERLLKANPHATVREDGFSVQK